MIKLAMVAITSSFAPQNASSASASSSWEEWQPLYEELLLRTINNLPSLQIWIADVNRVAASAAETFAWRYVRLTTDTTDEAAVKAFEYHIQQIQPNLEHYRFLLNQKLLKSPYLDQLPPTYQTHIQLLQKDAELFRTENIERHTQERLLGKQYGNLLANISIEWAGETYPLQASSRLLESSDPVQREAVYRRVAQQFYQQQSTFEELFDDLRNLRGDIAKTADHDNYRSYKFKQLARFDYTPDDCLSFHDAIRQEVLPLLTKVHERKCKELNVSMLRPWDITASPEGTAPLQPIQSDTDLVQKSIQVLREVDTFFGDCIKQMYVRQHLDLETRPNKRPGGYQMPLPVTGVPFIFMNASGSVQDLRTFMHESGHAAHSVATHHLPLMSSKHPPVEIAELAAMSMELLSMDKWHIFFGDESELRRAQIWLLENILQLLPWIAVIDRFQHWIYIHPEHSKAERTTYWLSLLQQFKTPVMNYDGLEEELSCIWYRQLHLFEAPFYYIEYGIAQLGAIAIWKNYKEKGQVAVDNYKQALQLGYTRSIKEVYERAGIQFDFSAPYLSELIAFLKSELTVLWAAADSE